MPVSERDVRRPGGRTLRVLEDGVPEGEPVFVLHGMPGSRLLYPKHAQDAAHRGLRLIGYDRPGYGGSSPHPTRRIADAAADVLAIADALRLPRFGVWGFSGGGAPALACAALLPDRVAAAACLSAGAPYPVEGLDWLAGMGEANVTDFRLMLSDRVAWERKLNEDCEDLKNASREQLAELFSSLLSEVDRAALTNELLDFLRGQIREGLGPGSEGLRDDNLAVAKPWGFELSSINLPLQLWHGAHDRFAPFSHGVWLADHLPQAETHFEKEEGHLSLLERRIPEVHEWLASQL